MSSLAPHIGASEGNKKKMKKEINILVVVNEDGTMLPMAGIWLDDEHGKISTEIYLRKNKNTQIIKATIIKK